MACDTEQVDGIEACRTCGIYYMSTTNFLKPLFQSVVDNPEMMLIRMELAQWKVEINESDGLPQQLCSSCIHEFQKVFKFRTACMDTQNQLRAFYNLREENLANITIKTETPDANNDDGPRCDFIYVDDFSDEEYDSVTPFNIPHMPIKEEFIEAATVPQEDDQRKPMCMAESASAGGADANIPTKSDPPQQENNYSATATAIGPTTLVMDKQILDNSNVECELCQHNSPSLEEHKKHTSRVHENRDMECHICGKVFKNSTQNRFKFHLKWHNISKHVKCPQCGFVCSSRQGLKEHKRAVHAKINCKICGKVVLAKKMKGHLRKHEIVTQFQCEHCAEGFSSVQERYTHILQIHANLNSSNSLNANNLSRGSDDEESDAYDVITIGIMCARCDENFEHSSDLQHHVKLVHSIDQVTWPLIKSEKIEEVDDSIDQNLNTSTDSLAPKNETSIKTKEQFSYFDNEEMQESLDEESEDEREITVFEGYDEEEVDRNTPKELKLIKENLITNKTQMYFNQISSNISPDYQQNDEDEVTIEHFGQEVCEINSNKEKNSVTNLKTEIDSKSAYISNDIPEYSCAKCTASFGTVDKLREHYKQHQLDQNESSSPSKLKFQCHICDRHFDLKFSLNRHIKKHKSLVASE